MLAWQKECVIEEGHLMSRVLHFFLLFKQMTM